MYSPERNERTPLLEWSVAVLGLGAAVFFASQIHINILDKERVQMKYDEARVKVGSLASTAKLWEESFQKRQIHLQRAESEESRYTAFMNELLELSKSDADARTLVYRHKVGGPGPAAELAQARPTLPTTAAPQRAVDGIGTKQKTSVTR
jgi:hypothetical protein